MAFENRLRKKLPKVGEGRMDAMHELAIEEGAIGDENTLVDKHEPTSYAMTPDTFKYLRMGSPVGDNFVKLRIDSENCSPTMKDYEKGHYIRYFIGRYDALPIEVSKDSLQDYKPKLESIPGLYRTAAIRWTLIAEKQELPKGLSSSGILGRLKAIEVGETGLDIAKINERYTKLAEKGLPGVVELIAGDYTRHTVKAGGSIMNDQYTAGGEYYKANGESYIGYYHIHSTHGAMVGRYHTENSHDLLIPKSKMTPTMQSGGGIAGNNSGY
jgi:hypothetical protein